MPPLDLIIIVVYLISLAYIGYQAVQNWVNSLEDTLFVKLDQQAVDAQLEEQGLKGVVSIKVGLKDKYKYEPIKDLTITVNNTSPRPVYVDWDRSTLTNFGGRSRRVIRVTPTLVNLNLSRPQIFSVVAPGQSLTEKIIAEDMLKPGDGGNLQIVTPIETLAEANLATAVKIFKDKPPSFSLRLALWTQEPGSLENLEKVPRAVTLRFEVTRILGTSALPWNRKK